MNQYTVWLIILLVLGVVISNLMVLKYSAKFKWPSRKARDNQADTDDKSTSEDERSEQDR